MAIALQGSNKVWMKVRNALANASPGAQLQFKELKMWLATQKKNPDLQFVPFSAADVSTDTGSTPVVGAATLYAIYAVAARTSGATASFLSAHDATTNGATTTTVFTAKINAAGQEVVMISPSGLPLATDLTLSAATAVGGATESSAADAANGFAIVGA